MNEAFLHYIWKHELFDKSNLCTTTGQAVEVISVGLHNHDAGPDFSNARLRIGDTLWAGNVEIHDKSSDWFAHSHQHDRAYDSVILQVVNQADTLVQRTHGEPIETAVLSYPELLTRHYQALISHDTWVACENTLQLVDDFAKRFWLQKLSIVRLERKALAIGTLLQNNQNNWEETFYQLLCRSLGARVNSDTFEQLARSLPLTILAKNKNNLFALEALLFGQASFLTESTAETQADAYFLALQKEYLFQQKKYGLTPLKLEQWKFLRLRPAGFPTVRIAQLAALIHQSNHLFSRLRELEHFSDYSSFFEVETSEYWLTHYTFGKTSRKSRKNLGSTVVTTLVINTVVPILFSYSQSKEDMVLQDRALTLWEEIPAEKNNVIDKWTGLGFTSKNAFDTQALLELKNEFCSHKRCLDCAIGNKIIQQ